ncbi:MAG TPA: ankyrin repeat domain-containing protein [Pseudomonadales bacterium]
MTTKTKLHLRAHCIATFALPVFLLASLPVNAGPVADAAQQADLATIRQLLQQGVNVNEPQIDGTTALHWAVQANDTQMTRVLIEAGADVSARNRVGAPPLLPAAINGNAELLELLLGAGADPNQAVSVTGDTPLMLAARTGLTDAIDVLLAHGADVNAREAWGHTTPLMWAVAQNHADAARLLIENGADIEARSVYVPPDTGRGFEGGLPRERRPEEVGPVVLASGEFTPLLLAARDGHLEAATVLVEAGADVDAIAADGKNALSLAIFNGSYALADYLVEAGSDVNNADAQRFTPLFWAVDRRNMETAPNFPWIVTDDPLPLIEKLLQRGADPNWVVNETPRARMRGGAPRIVFATALMRAAFAADLELVQLLLAHGADPHIKSKDNETALAAAAGLGWVHGFHKEGSRADRLEIVRILVEMGSDVNWQDNYGISPLMVAGNLGDVPIIQYLIDNGADLGAYDLGKKNDGAFGASIEPLMPIDYAIGVGTFRPNNAIVFNEEAYELMKGLMMERGIVHQTSECTLRGFTCAAVNMDPRAATPKTILEARLRQVGHQVDDVANFSGLEVKDEAEGE